MLFHMYIYVYVSASIWISFSKQVCSTISSALPLPRSSERSFLRTHSNPVKFIAIAANKRKRESTYVRPSIISYIHAWWSSWWLFAHSSEFKTDMTCQYVDIKVTYHMTIITLICTNKKKYIHIIYVQFTAYPSLVGRAVYTCVESRWGRCWQRGYQDDFGYEGLRVWSGRITYYKQARRKKHLFEHEFSTTSKLKHMDV